MSIRVSDVEAVGDFIECFGGGTVGKFRMLWI